MESRCSCNLMIGTNFWSRRNLPPDNAVSHIPIGSIKNPKTPCTVGELALAWWFRSGWYGIIRDEVEIPVVFQLVNTDVQILMGEIGIFGKQQVHRFEIGSMPHLINESLDCLFHSGSCNHQDWFRGWYKCWMPVRWCCLDRQQVGGHRIQSLEWIPMPFFTDNARKVIVPQNHPLFKGIPPWNGQRQPHYTILSHQFANHCRCHWGECLSNTHFICHQYSWHISITTPPHHNEPYGPNLVCQTLSTRQAWNWILVVQNPVICWLMNMMSIQKPDCLIKTLEFKFIVDCNKRCVKYWGEICSIEKLLTVLHLLLNHPCSLVCDPFFLNNPVQLLIYKLDRWYCIPALQKLIAMLGISQQSNHWNEYIWMRFNQLYSFDQNLH